MRSVDNDFSEQLWCHSPDSTGHTSADVAEKLAGQGVEQIQIGGKSASEIPT
jgi:hypothetical protein